ncbi:MAG: transposon-transfer assisting family protein [Oscillospiraceae bacterium]|nr:transposon-transfer assisting family protein [Oscillospiraceae bacterium]
MIIALDKFSTEELNLMSIFDTADREILRNDLVTALHDVYEPDMIEIFGSTLEKLDGLTDEEFAELGFFIADDEMLLEGDAVDE